MARMNPNFHPKTLSEVRDEFSKNGISVRKWAENNNFPYDAVQDILLERRKGRFGISHDVAVALGLKEGKIVQPGGYPRPKKAAKKTSLNGKPKA
jgi:gp16 family phage-associated protein